MKNNKISKISKIYDESLIYGNMYQIKKKLTKVLLSQNLVIIKYFAFYSELITFYFPKLFFFFLRKHIYSKILKHTIFFFIRRIQNS